MQRRTVVAVTGSALAGLSGLAGCLGAPSTGTTETEATAGGSSSPTPPSETATEGASALAPGESATLSDGRTVTVATPTVQVSTLWNDGAFSVLRRDPGVQFLVCEVTGLAAEDLDPKSFALGVDGDLVEPAGRFQ
jgi:ABC-type phosphate transport system substrate-binding protein